MKKAFSLIELLISLIVISVIIASFAPILSKKLKSREIVFSSVKQMKIDCSPFDAPDGVCLLCEEDKCTICSSSFNIADGYYVNPSISCNRKPCSDFDSNCKRCTKDGCQECKNGYTFNPSTKTCSQVKCNKGYKVSGSGCVACEENTIQPNDNSTATSCTPCSDSQISNSEKTICNNVTCPAGKYRSGRSCYPCTGLTYQPNNNFSGTSCYICSGPNASVNTEHTTCTTYSCPNHCKICPSSTKCDECEEGYKWNGTECEEIKPACSPTMFTLNDGSKATKYNMGDDPNCTRAVLETISNVNFVSVGTTCNPSSANPCCWYGQTANQSSCTSTSGSIYGSCKRTVCDWWAAKALCEAAGMKLPATQSSIANWYSKTPPSNSTSTTGLMLCDFSSSNDKHYRCADLPDCKGGQGNTCDAGDVWTAEESGSTQAKVKDLDGSDGWHNNTRNKTRAASVRCVPKD